MRKKFTILIVLAIIGLSANAQTCDPGGCSIVGKLYPNIPGNVTPTTSWTLLKKTDGTTAQMNGGNYTLFNVTCNNTYDWTYCGDYAGAKQGFDAELTLYNYSTGSRGALLCYQNNISTYPGTSDCPYAPYLRWTATFTGVVQLLTTEVSCQSNSSTSDWSNLAYEISSIGSPCCLSITTATGSPSSQSVCSGNSATFNVTNDGDAPYTYTWYNISTGAIVGTSSTFSTTTAGSYYCEVKNCTTGDVKSNTVNLTVNPGPITPVISAQGGITSFCQGTGSATLQVTNICSGCTYTWYPSGSGTSINVTNAGTYYCTSSNTCGGPSPQSNSIVITVNPGPTTPVISAQGGITSFCQGTGSATLQVTNTCSGCTYTWYPSGSGTSINVTNAGTYYCTSSNTCGGPSPQSNSIAITVNTVPTVSFTQSGSACKYNFTDNSSGTPISWNWNFGDPSSLSNTSILQDPSHIFTSSGSYNVSLQATNTCGSNSANNNITVTTCSGINEINSKNNEFFSIIPNPITNSALIKFTIIKRENVSIKLYDIIGKEIFTIADKDYNPGNYSIIYKRPENLISGIYFIKFVTENYNATQKIIIN